MREFRIDTSLIGADGGCYVIAEAGVNHNGDVSLALDLVDRAAEAGANAVKFQTFKANKLVTRGAPKARYQNEITDSSESQYDMIEKLELSENEYDTIIKRCGEKGITFLSTPFDRESADFLEGLGVPAYKISSGDLNNGPLLAYIARKGKPVILSTGMSTIHEVEEATQLLERSGCTHIALLHCVSSYPAPADQVNLRAIETLRERFEYPVGYSDHTVGIEIPLAAAALGAVIIEKHFTLDRSLPGPDHRASLEPGELAAMVSGIRIVEAALGDGVKQPVPAEKDVMEVARRSVVASRAISKGSVICEDDLSILRPGTGINPMQIDRVIGRTAARDIPAGELIMWDMLQ